MYKNFNQYYLIKHLIKIRFHVGLETKHLEKKMRSPYATLDS